MAILSNQGVVRDPRFSITYKCEVLVFLFKYECRSDWDNKPYMDTYCRFYDPCFDHDFMNPNFLPLDDE